MAKRKKTDRVQLPIRMREALRAQLEKAAKARDVSINSEVVDRLERSFERLDLLGEVLALAYGPEWAAFLVKCHKHGILSIRDRDKELIRAELNKFVDTLPNKSKVQS